MSNMKDRSVPASDLGQCQHEVHPEFGEFQLGFVESKEGPQLQLHQHTDKNSHEAEVPWGAAAVAACVIIACSYRIALRRSLGVHWMLAGRSAETQSGSYVEYYAYSTYRCSFRHAGGN